MSVIIKGVEQDGLNNYGDYAMFSLAYEAKKNLINDLYPKYISGIYRSLKEIQSILDDVDDTLFEAVQTNELLPSVARKLCVILEEQSASVISGHLKLATKYLAEMFRRVIIDYFVETLGCSGGERVTFNIDIGLGDMTIREFKVLDYISGSDDIVETDIKRILGMEDVERFIDPETFCRALLFCMQMMIDIVTYSAIISSNRELKEITEKPEFIPASGKYSHWVEISGCEELSSKAYDIDFWYDESRYNIKLNSDSFRTELSNETYNISIEL
jgi:hypothetical protein